MEFVRSLNTCTQSKTEPVSHLCFLSGSGLFVHLTKTKGLLQFNVIPEVIFDNHNWTISRQDTDPPSPLARVSGDPGRPCLSVLRVSEAATALTACAAQQKQKHVSLLSLTSSKSECPF